MNRVAVVPKRVGDCGYSAQLALVDIVIVRLHLIISRGSIGRNVLILQMSAHDLMTSRMRLQLKTTILADGKSNIETEYADARFMLLVPSLRFGHSRCYGDWL